MFKKMRNIEKGFEPISSTPVDFRNPVHGGDHASGFIVDWYIVANRALERKYLRLENLTPDDDPDGGKAA